MFNRNKREKNTYGIIGLGKFGQSLALELAAAGEEIVVLDSSEEKVRELREYTENAFVLNSLDKAALYEASIQNCDIVVVCIGEKLDTSILTTLNLVGMGIKRVIAKANSPEHGQILEKLGAEVVFPEHDMALRLANRLTNSSVIDFVQLSEKINVTKLLIPKYAIGKSVIEMNFRGKFSLNIIAIENQGEVIEIVSPDYVFRTGDILFLAGKKSSFVELAEWVEKYKKA